MSPNFSKIFDHLATRIERDGRGWAEMQGKTRSMIRDRPTGDGKGECAPCHPVSCYDHQIAAAEKGKLNVKHIISVHIVAKSGGVLLFL